MVRKTEAIGKVVFYLGEYMKQGHRRLIKHGGSVGITLPQKFLKEKGWKAGDKVAVVFDDVAVIVKPVGRVERVAF